MGQGTSQLYSGETVVSKSYTGCYEFPFSNAFTEFPGWNGSYQVQSSLFVVVVVVAVYPDPVCQMAR